MQGLVTYLRLGYIHIAKYYQNKFIRKNWQRTEMIWGYIWMPTNFTNTTPVAMRPARCTISMNHIYVHNALKIPCFILSKVHESTRWSIRSYTFVFLHQ